MENNNYKEVMQQAGSVRFCERKSKVSQSFLSLGLPHAARVVLGSLSTMKQADKPLAGLKAILKILFVICVLLLLWVCYILGWLDRFVLRSCLDARE
jgi:hypothetical protein